MKKILFFLCFLAFTANVHSQIFSQKKVQVKANDQLAYVFGYLKSDTMIFKNLILPDPNTKVVMMHDAFGNPLYVLMASDVFDTTNSQISRLSEIKDKIIGLEFNLTYLSAFSWQNRKDIKKIKDPYQKAITKVFNTKVKYCLMQQGSHAVNGKRITDPKSPNYGQIVPDFSTEVMATEVAPTKPATPVVLTPVEKKDTITAKKPGRQWN